MRRFISIFSLCVLALLSVSASEAPFPLDPTIELPPTPHIFGSQSSDDYDERTLSPVADAFVASKYPYDWKEFGKEEFVAVGKHDVLGELTTYLTYTWSLPKNLLYVTEATLVFGAGGGNDEPLAVTIKRTKSFDEEYINGNSKPRVISEAGSGEIGELGYWYGFDVTETVQQAIKYSWTGSISFGVYTATPDDKIYKLSSSREFDPAFAPQLYVQHLVDNTPPQVWFEEPVPEWMSVYKDELKINGIDSPDPDQRVTFEVQQRIEGQEWEHLYRGSSQKVRLTKTGAISFRIRGEDTFGNISDWVFGGTAKVYLYDFTGMVTNHRRTAIPNVDPELEPDPWWVQFNSGEGTFTARLRDNVRTGEPKLDEYGNWGPHRNSNFPIRPPSTYVALYSLPPKDNLLGDIGKAEDPTQWEALYPDHWIELVESNRYSHAGDALRFVVHEIQAPSAVFCAFGEYHLENLNQPTFSFHYQPGFGSFQTNGIWQSINGELYNLGTIRSNWADVNSWKHAWFDLSPVRQIHGRPCVEQERLQGSWGDIIIDSISLGSTRSDFGLVISPPAQLPPPGEPYPVDLIVTNHSPYPATGMLHLTVEGEAEPQSWLLPELAPGETTTRSVILVSPAEEDTLRIHATVGKPEIDDTPWRNTAEWMAIRDAIALYQPFVLGW